jgi:malate dehydrogenase
MAIWGNHSSTMYPDYRNAMIGDRPAAEVIADDAWLAGEFTPMVQNRGAAIIKARGQSSAASAANAIIDSVRAVQDGTGDDWMSLAVVSQGQYGVPEGLVFSYPVTSDGRSHHVADGVRHGPEAQAAIKTTTDELVAEQAGVADLVPA